MPSFEDLRYDYPKTFCALIGGAVVTVTVAVLAAIPNTAETEAMGLVALRERINALQDAAYWRTRALINPRSTLTPNVEYGFVLGIAADRKVVVSVPIGDKFVTRMLQLANIVVTDLEGAGARINRYRQTNCRIEMYGDKAVIWIEEQPLNVDLIREGLATPEENPPTDIVDHAFATYYWSLAKRGNAD